MTVPAIYKREEANVDSLDALCFWGDSMLSYRIIKIKINLGENKWQQKKQT
jgi:hypothetical protein